MFGYMGNVGDEVMHDRQLRIHDVINVNQLKLFEPPLLEEVVTINHPTDNIPDF